MSTGSCSKQEGDYKSFLQSSHLGAQHSEPRCVNGMVPRAAAAHLEGLNRADLGMGDLNKFAASFGKPSDHFLNP